MAAAASPQHPLSPPPIPAAAASIAEAVISADDVAISFGPRERGPEASSPPPAEMTTVFRLVRVCVSLSTTLSCWEKGEGRRFQLTCGLIRTLRLPPPPSSTSLRTPQASPQRAAHACPPPLFPAPAPECATTAGAAASSSTAPPPPWVAPLPLWAASPAPA